MDQVPLLYTLQIITDVFADGGEQWRLRITLASGVSEEWSIDSGDEVNATHEARKLMREHHGLRAPAEA